MIVTRVAIRFRTAIFVLMGNLVIAGLLSFYGMPREMFPDIEIPVVVVSVPYPGASPTDVEQLILTPLETELKGVKNIDKLKGTAYEGAAVVSLEFVPEANIDEALQAVRDGVSRVRPDLPSDILDPTVKEVSFSDFPILIVNVSGPYALDRLEAFAKRLEDEIVGVPGVLSADVSGGIEQEVRVEVDPERAAASGIALSDIVNAIRSENVNLPGGVLEAATTSWLLRTPADLRTEAQLASITVKAKNGKPIQLADVATVSPGYEKRATYARINGRTAVSLNITKRSGSNIIEVVDGVKAIVDRLKFEAPSGTEIKLLQDQSVSIRQMIDDLVNNIITGLLLVIAVLFFFMGARNATLVSLAVPLSMLMTFIVLDVMGVTLNMVTLFSLILAMGMLVDNAIVIIENIYRHLGERIGPADDASVFRRMRVVAAYTGTAEVAWPVIASTATTVAAFAPLLFWPGIMGKFMGYLPLVVIITLTSSLVIGLVINPVTAAVFMARPSAIGAPSATDPRWEDAYRGPLSRIYGAVLRFAISYHRKGLIGPLLTMVIAFAALVGSLFAYGASGNGVEFFPETTPERATIAVTAPGGTSLGGSDRIVRQIEAVLAGEKNVLDFVATPGAAAFSGRMGGGAANTHVSGVSIDFQKEANRVESTLTTIDTMRAAFDNVAGARIEVNREKMGPPSGSPIQVEIIGPSYDTLGALSTQVMTILREMRNDGVADPKTDYVTGRPEVSVIVDRQAAREVGASTSLVASTIRNAFNGTEATVIRDGRDERDIIVRYKGGRRETAADLKSVRVPGKDGVLVPLDALAKVVRSSGAGTIRHLETRRVVTLAADIASGANANKLREALAKRLDNELHLPVGTSWHYGGENAEQQKASEFLGRALLIGLFGILLILVAQFNSILKPVIIMSSVVLSLVGVFTGLVITGKPFGVVMTGLGVISLAGVVVNNAIVLIDFIESLRTAGLPAHEAVLRAGLVRLRPVLLTALTTVLGLIPMAIGLNIDFINMKIATAGGSGEFWGGMAIAVSFGLTFATVLTLVAVPALYLLLDRIGTATRRLLFGTADTIDIDVEIAKDSHGSSTAVGAAAGVAFIVAALGFAATVMAPSSAFAQAGPTLALQEPEGAPERLTLDAVLHRLDQKGPDLAVARARLEASGLIVDRAWSALHPVITATGNYTLNDPVMELSFGDPEALRKQAQAQIDAHVLSLSAVRAQMQANGQATPVLDGAIASAEKARDDMPLPNLETVQINRRHGLSAQLQLRMTLYDARTLKGLEIARTTVKVARNNLALTRNGLRIATAKAFAAAVMQRESVAVLARRLKSAERELDTLNKRMSAGVGTPLSRKMAELRVLQAERAKAAGQLAYHAAVATVGMLIGADHRFEIDGDVTPVLPEGDITRLVDAARARRPEIAMIDDQQKIIGLQTDAARRRWLPRLSLVGQTQWQNAAGFGGQNVTSMLMVTLTQQIWDGGTSRIDGEEAALDLRVADIERQRTDRRIAAEVRGAYAVYHRAQQDFGLSQRAVEVSEAAVADARIGRDVGTNTELELLGLEDRVVEAQLSAVQAKILIAVALLDVRAALGLPPLSTGGAH